ncbi:hypothetical protein FNV43_RR23464 [Rhamnella rubrinervis]|uniref:Uncharacterized protein n=1 Tax=Rhamnella rubrinervis TaxID=2594499 RepID=A0A8K0E3V2_9ROSA|nr:hypothetical protein FNV43_RR23464 [Rhamnella rubrinervis]
MDVKKFMDVSSFMLFEATGDSDEAGDSDPTVADHYDHDHCDNNISDVAMDLDDAESCSWDLTDHSLVIDDHDLNGGDVLVEEYVYDDDEEEEVDPVYQKWGGASVDRYKSCASVDSTEEFELLNEVEKNRVFWETCLAS